MPQSLSSILIQLIFSTKTDGVLRYLARQKEHHRRVTFQDEYRKFLKPYQVPYDERYVWD